MQLPLLMTASVSTQSVWFKVLKPYRGRKDSKVHLRFGREPVCGGLQGSSAQTIGFLKRNESTKALASSAIVFVGLYLGFGSDV